LDKKKRKSLKPHYYKIFIEECVLCGLTITTRVRVYGKKPKRLSDIYDYEQFACGEHFM